MNPRIATIGRPGLGGEFLAVEHVRHCRYRLSRRKQVTYTRDEPRQFEVKDLPASTLVYDLLSAIEGIVKDAEERGCTIDLDDKGLGGDYPTLRDRLRKLAG